MKITLLTLSLLSAPVMAAPGDHSGHNHETLADELGAKKSVTYTCPMHPNIKTSEPGTCPICGMDLVPMKQEASASPGSEGQSVEAITVNQDSRRLAGISTYKVEKQHATRSISAVGTLAFDEGRVSTISAYVDGRVEKVYADYVGVKVKKNEHLAELYSPSLYAAQVEYLHAGNALREGVKVKLSELGMTDRQIRALTKTRKAKSRLTLVSRIDGTVIQNKTLPGSYVKTGQVLFKVADLSTVWLLLDIFPEDAQFLRFGLKVNATLRSMPGHAYSGRISFIDPVVNAKTRTVRVRVEIPNSDLVLRPGDLAQASIEIPLGISGKFYDPELAGKYVSPMHPQHMSDKPGECPVCGMKMVPASHYGYTDHESAIPSVITVPRDAVLTMGKKSVVFIESTPNRFTLREVVVGTESDDNKLWITSGLSSGDVIASSGVFLIDSQMQLSGKTSLMQVTMPGKKPMPAGHNH